MSRPTVQEKCLNGNKIIKIVFCLQFIHQFSEFILLSGFAVVSRQLGIASEQPRQP